MLTLTLTIVDAANACAPIAGAHVEIWCCDAGGVYSEYANSTNEGSTSTTYLRGVQTTDSAGQVTFKCIYPGWYSPRATHIHIQVYNGTTLKKTTQIGFPDATNVTVYLIQARLKFPVPAMQVVEILALSSFAQTGAIDGHVFR